MGNKTEFKTRNGLKSKTRRDGNLHFSTKNKKIGGKTGGKTPIKQEKKRKLQEIQKQDFGEISGKAEKETRF